MFPSSNFLAKGPKMLTAAEWVRHVVAASRTDPMTTEGVLKSLEKAVGQGDKSLARVVAIIDHLDRQLSERPEDQVLRDLHVTVLDYLERVQEGLAAA
jgi:hypothetical protein